MRHAQTLDERGRFWRHGRWWWGPVRAEWSYRLRPEATLSLALGGGDDQRDLQLHVSSPLFAWFVTVRMGRWIARLLPGRLVTYQGRQFKVCEERQVSIAWHNGGLWWYLWMSPNEFKSTDPRWRRGHFEPAQFLFGRAAYSRRVISEHRVLIPMPERAYPATVVLAEDAWKRPRWPGVRYLRRAEVTPDEGIPHAGKGENSWDCGDDATYGLTTPARTVAEAVGAIVECVYRDRLRYGICAPDQQVKVEPEEVIA